MVDRQATLSDADSIVTQSTAAESNFDDLINQKISKLIFNCIENLGLHVYVPIKMPMRGFLNSDNFFSTDPESLRIWGDIQTLSLTLAKTSLLDGFIAKLNFSSLFMKKHKEELVQIRALQRISFIIFAHERDSKVVVTQIRKVLNKVIKVLVGPSPSNQLLVYIFFALRIVLTRLHEDKVALILQNIWPIVMITIIKIFDNAYDFNHDPNVQLATLKFLQLLQIKRYSNLFNHQWIITPDFYAMHLSPVRGLGKFDNFRNVGCFSFDSLLGSALPRNHVLQYVIDSDKYRERMDVEIEFISPQNRDDAGGQDEPMESLIEDDSDLSNLSEMSERNSGSEEPGQSKRSSADRHDSSGFEKLPANGNSLDSKMQIICENYVHSRVEFVGICKRFLETCLAINKNVFSLNQEGLEKLVFSDFIDLERHLDKFEIKKG